MHVGQSANFVHRVPLQADADRVVAVRREVVTNGDASARSQRQVLAHPFVLDQILRRAIYRQPRHGRPERQLADLARGGHVAIQQRRRGGQHLCDVVESQRGIIRRQQRIDVQVQAQQVAHRIAIFGSVQPMDGRAAGIGMRTGRAIELSLEPCRERPEVGRPAAGVPPQAASCRSAPFAARPPMPARWDRPAQTSSVSSVTPATRTAPVVAGHAVPVQKGLVREGRLRGRSRGRRRGRLLRGLGCGRHRHGDHQSAQQQSGGGGRTHPQRHCASPRPERDRLDSGMRTPRATCVPRRPT